MSDIVTVSVAQGKLRGREATTKSGGTYYSFQGIPYAKPPVGPLRFKAPQPADSWDGMRDALVEGPTCAQIELIKKEFKGEEDCLYLNVYTPKLPGGSEDFLKAVMVWIHGGGFAMGDGNSWIYGPDYLVAEGVVLVTLNYRLGPLGFLSTGDSVIPGNAGLKDQVMALRWIQQNIAQFGGDPGNVTIFGGSSGGACVHFHVLSPMSEGLFHHAISQSGLAINPWAFEENPRKKAFTLGEVLGCRTNDSNKLVEFLRSVSVQRLVESQDKLKAREVKYRGKCLFTPVIERGRIEGEEIFLYESPTDLMTQGRFHKVPFIIGITSHEGLLMLKEIQLNPQQLDIYNKNFEHLVKRIIHADLSDSQLKEAARKVRRFYFGDRPLCQETLLEYVDTITIVNFNKLKSVGHRIQKLKWIRYLNKFPYNVGNVKRVFVYHSLPVPQVMQLNTDVQFVLPIYMYIQRHLVHSTFPVYCYRFSFDGKLAYLKQLLGMTQYPGVCHSDELGYLFRVGHMDPDLDSDSPEAKTRSRLVKMWTNFAKTGCPTPKKDWLVNVLWKPTVLGERWYLNIDTELTMHLHLNKERITFWEDIFRSLEE